MSTQDFQWIVIAFVVVIASSVIRHSANVRYLRTVLKHKWYVYRFGRKLGLDRGTLLIHDMTKFSRAEWSAYRNRFASGNAGKEDKFLDPRAFRDAWRHHYTHNPHHWEFWLMKTWGVEEAARWPKGIPAVFIMGYTEGRMSPSPEGAVAMPERFAYEMVADWQAASKAYTGKDDCMEWYTATRDKQVMHPKTRALVDHLLNYVAYEDYYGPGRGLD